MFRGLFQKRHLFWLVLLPLLSSFSQENQLKITFDRIAIQDTTDFRGVTPGFPYPVLSFITVQDQDNRYVHGLADTARWLGPMDTTQTGALVDDVWKVILEYHKENHAIPVNPDVKQMDPSYRVIELYNARVSTALVMDYSGSMEDDIVDAEEGARVFVRQMKTSDQTAIIKFSDSVKVFQEFTSDTTLLMEAIAADDSSLWGYTALYDAIYEGVDRCLDQPGRRVVVAYTDGNDNKSQHDILEAINFAHRNGIPVFTIGIGEVHQTPLRMIAELTGGVYYYIPSTEELGAVYIEIYGLISGQYVMAHTSTDSIPNGTWRTVDLTMRHDGVEGRGTGEYYVPYVPPDVRVSKRVFTDSVSVEGQETIYYGIPGDTGAYEIRVTNDGPTVAEDVRVVDFPADSLLLFGFDLEPEIQTEDSVRWQIPQMDIGETVRIGYRCFFDTLRFPGMTALTNRVRVACDPDTALHNNADSSVVHYIPLLPADVVVMKRGVGDSLVVHEGDTTWYVYPGNTVEYKVSLINQGELVCRDIQVQEILPEKLTLVDFPGVFYTQQGDTLSWYVDWLDARGGRRDFTYTCRLDTFMPPWNVPLVNWVTAVCVDDTTTENNSAQDTVWAAGLVPPDPEVRASPAVIEPTDSVAVEVMTPVDIQSWDLMLFFEDGSWIDTYGDAFIQSTVLTPQVWTLVEPLFEDTWMRTEKEEERVGVIFETVDLWDVIRADTAIFTIRSADAFYLDENVFRTDGDGALGMRFKLSSNRRAQITVYDVAGGFVKHVVDGPYRAGWNYCEWDGKDENGRMMGSGVYVAVLSSGNFRQIRKFILVR